ncbi:MAG: hypothetical protein LQ349_007087 [Xanthoria aureola]|nr:MAG: hypothetical protein LQ349_007087 [Xanthoria aureola]
MEALAAFSLVAGILQVLDVSFRAVKEYREIYKDGSVAAHRDTSVIVEALARATSSLNTPQPHSPALSSSEDVEIVILSRSCCAIATELHAEFKKLQLGKGGYGQVILKAVQSRRKARWLRETHAKLNVHIRTLDTLILITLDTRSLRHSYNLDTLDRDVRDLALRIERGVNTTARLLVNQTSQILDHFDQKFDVQEREAKIDQARQLFLTSLFFPDIEARKDEVKQSFEGTCSWVFDPPMDTKNNAPKWHNFRQWLEIGQAVYWISGKPGSGKSTLMKYIVEGPRTAEYLSSWKRGTELIIVTFFFKDLGTWLQKSATGLLRSIIWQITQYWPGMIDLVLRRYGQSTGPSPEPSLLTVLPTWTETRLLQMLKDFINEKPAAVSLCAFLDGLDEYDGDEDIVLEVIHLLSSASGCKVCVSSRPDPVFLREFEAYPRCRVQDLNMKDIEKMAIEKLKPCLVKDKPTETEAIDELVSALIEKAEGVFLWLSVMIKDLTKRFHDGGSIDELFDRIHETPNSMYGLYQRMLQRLDRSYLAYAFNIFQILIAAGPLYGSGLNPSSTLLGLACGEDSVWVHVTQFDRSYFSSSTFDSTCRELRTRLNARCGNLIEIASNENGVEETIVLQHHRTVSFIHRTAVEFLREEYESTFSGYSCLAGVWVQLARLSIGSMFLFPLTQSSNGLYELQAGLDGDELDGETPSADGHYPWLSLESDLAALVGNTMSAISFGERFASNTDFKKPLGNLQCELTAQTLQTLRYMATTDDVFKAVDHKHYYSMKRLLMWVERQLCFVIDNIEARAPFQDDMGFAAIWGCESCVRSRLSPETSDEQLEAILSRAILGMKVNAYSRRVGFPISWLNSADVVLQMRQMPRGTTNNWRIDKEFQAPVWDNFFLRICESFEKWLIIKHDPFGERAAWTQRCHEIIEKFLSLGADPNKRICHFIHVRSTSEQDFCILVDQTPLAVIQWYRLQEMDGILEIEAILKSKGAVNKRRYRFCLRERMYYRIDTYHSKDLDNLLLSRPRFYDFQYHVDYRPYKHSIHFGIDDGEVFNALERIFSTNEPLNMDTAYHEWLEEDSDWLEDTHERQIHPQQELQLSRRHSF